MITSFSELESPCGIQRDGRTIISKLGESVFWSCGCKRVTVNGQITLIWCKVENLRPSSRKNEHCFEAFENGRAASRRNGRWMLTA